MYLTDYLKTSVLINEAVDQFKSTPGADNTNPVIPQQASTSTNMDPNTANPMLPPDNSGFADMPADPNMIDDFQQPTVEFEQIKKYILFGRLKEIKQQVDQMEDLNRHDPDILAVFEFMNLIILFYNTFSYVEAVGLVDTLVEKIGKVLNIKPDKTPSQKAKSRV